jgi:ATP-binding cassette subfamily B multidrug efflux pump
MYYKGFALVILSTIAQVAWPNFLRQGIDELIAGTATSGTLMGEAALIVVFSFASGFCYYLVRQYIIVASRHIEYDIRNDLLAHVERLSMRYFQNTPQGEIMAYATNDIEAVRFFVGPAIMYTSDTIATFVAAFGYMLILSPGLSIISVLPLPLMSIGVYFIGKRVHPLFDAVQSHFGDMTARATESMSGMRVVRAYVREEYEQGIWQKLVRGFFDKQMKLAKAQGLMQPVIFGFMGLSTVILVLIGGQMIIDHHLSIGVLSQFFVYLGMLTWPFIAIGYVTNQIQRSAASMTRLTRLFETEPEIKNTEKTNWQIADPAGDLEFNKVCFRYRPELPAVLDGVSLKIPRGSTLAIMGRTGAGKSSFVNLIARLYDPTEGSITLDGHDLRTIPVEVLRAQIGFVTQEPFLFSETIEENITFGHLLSDSIASSTISQRPGYPELPKPNPLGTEEAAKAADIYDNVMEFPERFSTMLGERGITLSGGQKQRTAIARAIARNPKILILDDAMSAVDTATEERILKNLRNNEEDRTVILISHRTSTAKEANRIVVLGEGVIQEQGTHEELLALGGHYFDLYQRQLLEESLLRA